MASYQFQREQEFRKAWKAGIKILIAAIFLHPNPNYVNTKHNT